MKSLWSTLVIFILLAYLVTGSWYVRKCANKTGNCRKMCRSGELKTQPATGMCPKDKLCCILESQKPNCGDSAGAQLQVQAAPKMAAAVALALAARRLLSPRQHGI